MAVWRSTVTMNHPGLGGTGTNTFHARTLPPIPDPVEGNQLDQLLLDLFDFYTAIEPVIAGGTTIAHNGEWITVSEDEPRGYSGTAWSISADGADDSMPPADSLVITWKTSLAARKGRGRTFLGPLGSNVLQGNGTPMEDSRGLVHDSVDVFIASWSVPADGAYVVWSEKDGGVGRDIVSGRTRNVFGSLTSRRD